MINKLYGCNTTTKEPCEENSDNVGTRNPFWTEHCRFSRKWIDAKCNGCKQKERLHTTVEESQQAIEEDNNAEVSIFCPNCNAELNNIQSQQGKIVCECGKHTIWKYALTA